MGAKGEQGPPGVKGAVVSMPIIKIIITFTPFLWLLQFSPSAACYEFAEM